MSIKDYYGILEIESSASLQDIKKAYRRLAQQYHPDKNHNDPYAAAQFAEIKEAYEVLTHPSKKELYLQKRWYEQSIGAKKNKLPVTPVNILKQVLELERYVSRLDVFRMDKHGLHDHILTLLNDEAIEQLNSFNEKQANDEIIANLVKCLTVLPLNLILSLHTQLKKIKTNDAAQEKFNQFIIAKQKTYKRDKYKIWLIIITVIVLCMIILFAA
ncbi:MAG: J domain-containing protein [Chitinophagaceae bacterium]|nr:J domain-containing protein [Chitinophagaceae bacterium]